MMAMGPLVQQSPQLGPMVVEIYSAFARNFKLGKQAEDIIDQLADTVKKNAAQTTQKPDPEMMKAQAKMQAEQQKHQLDIQAKQADLQMKQAELQLKEQELALKERELLLEAQAREHKINLDMQRDEQRHAIRMASMQTMDQGAPLGAY